MKRQEENRERHDDLPGCVAEFLSELIRHMRYRRQVREEVRAELQSHFAEELRECKSEQEREKKAQEVIAGFGDVKLLATLLRRAKRRCRPPWQTAVMRTGQIAVLLVVCFIVYVTWFLAGRPVVTTDYVAQFNRLVRPPADESLNAAPFYTRAAAVLEGPPADIAELLKSEYGDLSAEQKQRLAVWLGGQQEMLDLIAEGTRRPHYWRTYESEEGMLGVFLPHVASHRNLIRVLGHRARLLADEGQHEEALATIQVCYRHGRHLRAGNKTLIEQIVGMMAQNTASDTLLGVLSRGGLEPARLARLQKELDGLFVEEDFAVRVAGEKLGIYDEIQRCFTAGRFGGEHLYPRRLASLSSTGDGRGEVVFDLVATPRHWGTVARVLFVHPDKDETRATIDRAYDVWAGWLRKTPAQLRAEEIDINDEMERMVKGNLLLEIMVPALGRVHELSYMTKVRFDAALAIVALLRYEAEKGRYPENLDELVTAGYLQCVPVDPWGAGPLTYRRMGEDFLLYGWGENFTDDGGRPGTDRHGDLDRWWAGNGDWVFWPVVPGGN